MILRINRIMIHDSNDGMYKKSDPKVEAFSDSGVEIALTKQ